MKAQKGSAAGLEVVSGREQVPGTMSDSARERLRSVLLERLCKELERFGVPWFSQPGGESIGLCPGLYASVSRDATRFVWNGVDAEREPQLHTWPADEVAQAADRIARRRDVLLGLDRWRA
jgi:hypothetical protein